MDLPESLQWLVPHEAARRAAGVRRELKPRAAESQLLDLASNDYLGLHRDPRVVAGGVAALRTWGAGSTALPKSRFTTSFGSYF